MNSVQNITEKSPLKNLILSNLTDSRFSEDFDRNDNHQIFTFQNPLTTLKLPQFIQKLCIQFFWP